MRFKTPSKYVLLMIVFVGFVLLPALYIYIIIPLNLTQNVYGQSLSPILIDNNIPLPKIEPVGIGLPVRLTIPIINVDANIESVGLTPEGAVGVPKDFANVSWFNLWPRPGENGNAIISGHYGIKNGKSSVFDNLYKLRKGDKLYIEDDQGVIITFVVRTIRRYDPQAIVPELFNSSDGKSHLNLITCEGVWDKILQSYTKRLVVYTDRE